MAEPKPDKGRTYTVEHTTGVRSTFTWVEHASAMTGWEGWRPTELADLPVGPSFDAVKSKAALLDYAQAMMVDTSDVTSRTTRADLEQLIVEHHREGPTP